MQHLRGGLAPPWSARKAIWSLSGMVLTSAMRQALVVQTLDSAIHRINHYPAAKYYGNQLRYPLDSDLSGG